MEYGGPIAGRHERIAGDRLHFTFTRTIRTGCVVWMRVGKNVTGFWRFTLCKLVAFTKNCLRSAEPRELGSKDVETRKVPARLRDVGVRS
jgi:hypothetical protein